MSHITIHVYDGDPEEYSDDDEAGTVGARIPEDEHCFSDGEELDAAAKVAALLADFKHFDVRVFNN